MCVNDEIESVATMLVFTHPSHSCTMIPSSEYPNNIVPSFVEYVAPKHTLRVVVMSHHKTQPAKPSGSGIMRITYSNENGSEHACFSGNANGNACETVSSRPAIRSITMPTYTFMVINYTHSHQACARGDSSERKC